MAENYAALIARDDVDAVYIALPASHHPAWVDAALAAGKAVLCEKPLSGNAPALRSLLQTGDGPVLMEAMHYFYHPLWARVEEIPKAAGSAPSRNSPCFSVPHIPPGDIRRSFRTAGGALQIWGSMVCICSAACSAIPCRGERGGYGRENEVDESSWVLTHAAHLGLTATVTASMSPEDPRGVAEPARLGRIVMQNPVAPLCSGTS